MLIKKTSLNFLSLTTFALSLILSIHSKAEELIIGLDADMSAISAAGGTAIKRGALLAIKEINNNGGVIGKKLALHIKDHKGNPARGVANMKYFSKKENLVAVLGGVHTPVALKELPIIHENNIIYLGPWAAGTPIVDNGFTPNYVFRLSVRDEHAGHVLINHAKERGLKKVGLLLERTGWGRSNEKSMSRAAKDFNTDISGVEWFNWRQKDMSAQIDNLINSGAEAILLVSNVPEGAIIVKNMYQRANKKQVPILSHWGIASGAFVKKAGLKQINSIDLSVLQTYSFLSPKKPNKMKKILREYQQAFDSTVSKENIPAAVGVAHAYDLVHLLAIAIKKANSTDRQLIRSALENIESYKGLFRDFTYPFTAQKHDALNHDDYIMSRFDHEGHLTPVILQQ